MNSKYMVIVAAMAVMLVGATAFTTGNAFAKYGSQAISQANKCGNDKMPMYVFCQNIDSQVQGENNGVALAGAQQSEEDRRGGGHDGGYDNGDSGGYDNGDSGGYDGGYDSKDQSAAAPAADQSANIAPPADQSAAAPAASEGGDGGYDDEAAPGTEATTGMNEQSNE
jgi:hypothetical protein